MNLADLLTYTASEFLDDRTALVSGDPDSLWSDQFLVRQFNQAQRLLCRRAWVLIDYAHPTAGTIVLKTNVAQYDLHKSVLRVFFAVPSDDTTGKPLGRFTDLQLRVPQPSTLDELVDNFVITSPDWDGTGRPLGVATDSGSRTLRVYRTPSSTENGLKLYLKVARLPINWLTLDDLEAEPEVPEDWHDDLMKYAAGRALTLPNVDNEQKAEGRRLLAEFDEAVKEARHDRQRAEMTPNTWYFDSSTAVLNERIR